MQKIRPDLDLGFVIQTFRRKRKMTQDDVVRQLQLMGLPISRGVYAKIETNRMNIKVSELIGLKLIFNVTFNDFFDGLIEDMKKFEEE